MRKVTVGFAFLVGLSIRAAILAQTGPDSDADHAPGYTNNIFHHSTVDSINTFNGQLTIPVAIGPSYPIGPKLKFQAMLTYNSRLWEYGNPADRQPNIVYTPVVNDPALGAGWSFNVGAIRTCGSQNYSCYIAPDGGEHSFTVLVGSYLETSDAAQFRARYISSTQGYEMWDSDGNHYEFSWHVSSYDDSNLNYIHDLGHVRDGWYLKKLTDPFGNSMSVTYWTNLGSQPCWTYPSCNACTIQMQCPSQANSYSWIPKTIVTPTATVTVSLGPSRDNGPSNMITSFVFPVLVNGGSSTSTWKLTYGQTPVSYTHLGLGPNINLETLSSISSVEVPTAQYSFTYGTSAGNALGLVQTMTLPTGAVISYLWTVYAFYHGRAALLGPTCVPKPPPDGTSIWSTGRATAGQKINLPSDPAQPQLTAPIACQPSDNPRTYTDYVIGVSRRTETVSGQDSATDYVELAFPFGELGSTHYDCPTGLTCSQTMTLVIFPPGIEGQPHATGSLFLGSGTHDGSTSIGDRFGADYQTRVFDHDPYGYPSQFPNQPACGGGYDNTFCANHAVRMTTRTFEYDDNTALCCNRHLQSETTYYQIPASNGTCNSCKNHEVAFTNTGSNTWEGNGRHYNVETHSGNLGNDTRAITITWTPSTSPYLPNLFNHRNDLFIGSFVKDQYFEFDVTTGFQKGHFTYDSTRQRALLNCRYADGFGNVVTDFTKTFASSSVPITNYCSTNYPSMPSVGTDGDAFGKIYTYQQSELLTARWLSGTSPLNWYKVNLTRDSSTGWVTSAADTAGLATTYLYDSLSRVTSITPPGEAATTITYPSTTQTIALRSGSGITTANEYDYDGLGRLIKEQRLMPGSQYANRFTKYDLKGHEYFKSEWVSDSTLTIRLDLTTTCVYQSGNLTGVPRPSGAPGTYSLCYDPFGRPQQVIGSTFSSLAKVDRTDSPMYYSDTKEARTTYCVNGTLATTESCSAGAINPNPTTTDVKDAFGRLTSVTEPSSEATYYAYDANDKLTSVTQGVQTRTFAYDPFGFLRTEITPEKGTVTNDSIGSLGNALQATEPGGLVTLRCYDAAGRVMSIRSNENGQTPACGAPGAGRVYVGNTYDQFASGSNYSLGKLTQRQGYNYLVVQVPIVTSAQAPIVTENLTYGGVGGRLSQDIVSIGSNVNAPTPVCAGENILVTESWTYNSLGLISSYTHPSTSGSFTESPTYDAGLPTSEMVGTSQSVFSSVGYWPAGAVGAWTAGNGVVTTIAQDASLQPRPASISTSGASSNFLTGTYTYDGAGNILAIGSDSFAYDNRSRLTSSSYSGLGSQAFAYDRYANLTQKGTTILSVSTSTNQITTAGGVSVAYDVRGNQTGYGSSEALGYDGLNRQTSEVTSGVEWDYFYDGAGERVVKIPGTNSVLQREAARYIVQGRGEQFSSANCPHNGHSIYFNDVNCSDPDVHWIDKFFEDGITTGCSLGNFCPGTTVNRDQMAVYIVKARNEQPATGCTSPTRFQDVPCSYPTWGYIEKLALDGIVMPSGPCPISQCFYYPTNATTETQMLVFLQRSWPTYLAVPRGSVYTLRDAGGRVVTELMSAAGGDTNNPPTNTTVGRDNVFLGSLLMATDVSSTLSGTLGWNWYHADHLGSPRLVTDSSHNQVEPPIRKYWPYGDEATGSATSQRLRFAAMERDTEANHYYDHARSHDFNLGRFLSPDEISGGALDPQTWNRYNYARANPIRLTDPTGLYTLDCGLVDIECAYSFVDFENARQEELKSPDPEISGAAAAYGDYGVANGVKVTFGDPGKGDLGKTVTGYPTATADPNKFQVNTTTTIMPGLKGIKLLYIVGHEGSHVQDAQAYVATLVTRENGVFSTNPSTHLTDFQTEVKAFHVSQAVFNAYAKAGERFEFGRCAGCTLGPGMSPAAVDQTILRILADPRGSYRLSAAEPGGFQVPYP